MSMESFIQQLEEAHTFPGPYTLKVIGTNDSTFIARVVSVAREALEMEFDPVHSCRNSSSGRHVSVTLELSVESAAGVAVLYEQMHKVEGLTMLI